MNKFNLLKGKWWLLVVIQFSNLIASIDSTIVNISLPTIAEDFGTPIATAQWVVTAYLICIMAGMLVAGRMADIFGRERVFAWGYILFTLASLLCGMAVNCEFLILSRILQAFGGSILLANASALLTRYFDGEARGVALGLNSTIVAVGYALGYILGGFITQYAGWRMVFLVNVPVGVLATIFCYRVLPPPKESGAPKHIPRFDWAGAGLSSVGLGGLLLGLEMLQKKGRLDSMLVAILVGSAVATALFVVWQLKTRDPLLHLEMFKYRSVSTGLTCLFMFAGAIGACNFVFPFYLQGILGKTSAEAGGLLLPYSISLCVLAPLTGWLSVKMKASWLSFCGFLLGALVMLSYLTLTGSSSGWWIAVGQFALGVAGATFLSPNRVVILSTVPDQLLGVASALIQSCRFLALSVGTLFASFALEFLLKDFGGSKVLFQSDTPSVGVSEAFLSGMDRIFGVLVGCLLLGAMICLFNALSKTYRTNLKTTQNSKS